MNPDPPHRQASTPDPALSRLLQSWEVDGTLPQGFTHAVHQRIADERKPIPRPLLAWIESTLRLISLLQRPAFATAYVAAGILVGAVTGSRHGQSPPTLTPADPQIRYVASIDPYHRPRSVAP